MPTSGAAIYKNNLLLSMIREIKDNMAPSTTKPIELQPVLDLVQGLALAWQRFQQELAVSVGLKRNSFSILQCVARAGEEGTLVSQVAKDLAVRPQGLSASVAELSRAGLLHRRKDQNDHRAWRLQVTEAGLELLGSCDGLTQDLAEEITRQIPQSAVARLILDRMVRSYNLSLARVRTDTSLEST
jgi:DNA-binding MarR family transcriptional regulator